MSTPTPASLARGRAIRARRSARQLTQEDLARVAKTDKTTISRLESGKIPRSSVGLIERVAAALDLSVDELDADVPRGEDAAKEAIWRRIRDYAVDDLHRAEVMLGLWGTRRTPRLDRAETPEQRQQDDGREDSTGAA